jgi:SHAQKYF class myb-like DNA-binding protein
MMMLNTHTHSHGGGLGLNIPPVGTPTTRGLWSEHEHEQFLQAMRLFPTGPWRSIAAYIGTRSIKQVQTHAQKYQQKINRRQRGLRKQKKKFVRPEHRVDLNATGCIQRVKPMLTSDSPRSPTAFPMVSDFSFGHMLLSSAASPLRNPSISTSSVCSSPGSVSALEFEDDCVLTMVEPYPFSAAPSLDAMLADDSYRQDVEESIDLLLS